MKKLLKMAACAALFSFSAAQAAELRIGVVDVERLLRESAPAMAAESKIEKTFSGRDQEIKRLMKQVKDLQTTLDRDNGMAEHDRRNKERELTNLNSNLQRMQREFREDLNLRKNEELAVVMEQANKAIQVIAESEKFDLILQEAVYRNPKIDITDKVIQFMSGKR